MPTQVVAANPGIDWQVILLAIIAMVPGLFAAYFANQARVRVDEVKIETVAARGEIGVVKAQTDGLTEQLKNTAFDKGVKKAESAAADIAVADAKAVSLQEASDAKLASLIEIALTRALASHVQPLVKTNGDPLVTPP